MAETGLEHEDSSIVLPNLDSNENLSDVRLYTFYHS